MVRECELGRRQQPAKGRFWGWKGTIGKGEGVWGQTGGQSISFFEPQWPGEC